MIEVEQVLRGIVQKPFFRVQKQNKDDEYMPQINWLQAESKSLLHRLQKGIDCYMITDILNLSRYLESLSSAQQEDWRHSMVKII